MYAFFADITIAVNFSRKGVDLRLKSFECPKREANIQYDLKVGSPQKHKCLVDTVKSEESIIEFYTDGYICYLIDNGYAHALDFTETDGKVFATVYLTEDDKNRESDEQIFDIMKFAVYSVLQKRNIIALHSASIVYNGKAVAFSANSGVGKSTHTNMWVEKYKTEIFNGDVTAIGIKDGKPICYAIPWCGSSELYITKNIPLYAICFLKRGDENYCTSMDAFDATFEIIRHCLSNNLTDEGMSANIAIAEKIACCTKVFYLLALPNIEAVDTAKKFIDNFIEL